MLCKIETISFNRQTTLWMKNAKTYKIKTTSYQLRWHSFKHKILLWNKLKTIVINSSLKEQLKSSKKTTSFRPRIKIYNKKLLISLKTTLIYSIKILFLKSNSKPIPSRSSTRCLSNYKQKLSSCKMQKKLFNPPSNPSKAIITSSSKKPQNNPHNLPKNFRANKKKSNGFKVYSIKLKQ